MRTMANTVINFNFGQIFGKIFYCDDTPSYKAIYGELLTLLRDTYVI
jgi:hypothetical protein